MKIRPKRIIKSLYHYFIFFLLIAFVITCCMMLFVTTMSNSLNITLTGENLQSAAKLTFANVILLSFICTVIDAIRRKLTVERPVRKIIDAAERIMHGDFNVRIQSVSNSVSEDGFNKIIDCFNKMAEELSGIETLRSDFIANVSHELKTPLSVIKNYGTMLQSPDITDAQRWEYAKIITDTSKRLADLITNILKLNKLENQQIFSQMQKYNLGEQLCECLLNFENVWEEKALEIETDIEEDVFIETDRELLTLVWNNLFSNAIKFTDNGGSVRLKLMTEGDFAVVKISDTGCGISKEVGNRMFDKFYQGDTSHSTQGNGLGLALVKRVIDITGSEIVVASEVGKGTESIVKMQLA